MLYYNKHPKSPQDMGSFGEFDGFLMFYVTVMVLCAMQYYRDRDISEFTKINDWWLWISF